MGIKKFSAILSSPVIRTVYLTAVIGMVFLLYSCKSVDYTAFKESRPRSILVMPPVNMSMDIQAPAAFLASSAYPLAESGYYVIPPALSDEMFKQNGIPIADEAWEIPISKLFEIFGADSALYITITKYGSTLGVISVAASSKLVDLRTGQELWSGKTSASEDSVQKTGTLGGLGGALLSAMVNQLINTLADRTYEVGRGANYQMLSAGKKNGILYGPYHPKYGTD